MILGILAVYGTALIVLGVIFMMCTESTHPSEAAALRRARVKRARKARRYPPRVHFDYRVKSHSTKGNPYR